MRAITKGTKVKYLGTHHSILKQGEIYKVHEVLDNGVRVEISTGFTGIPTEKFEVYNG